MEYLIDIMNEFVHLPEPRIRILIAKISPHGPHDMICPGYISLGRKKKKKSTKFSGGKRDFFHVQLEKHFKFNHFLNLR
jgi:hypothetical protein